MPSTTNLRKVGGSVMLAIPPAILDLMGLRAGSEISLALDGDRLILCKPQKNTYTLEDLLAECDFESTACEEDHLWLSSQPAGREVL